MSCQRREASWTWVCVSVVGKSSKELIQIEPRTTSTSLFSCWAGRAAGQPGLICWPTRLLCEKNDWFPKILVPKNESNRATAVPVVVGTLYSRKRVKCKAKVHIITDLSAVVTEPSPSMSGRSLSTPPLALLKSVQKKKLDLGLMLLSS